jgi:hypothetical protein
MNQYRYRHSDPDPDTTVRDSPLAKAPSKLRLARSACSSLAYVTHAMPSERPDLSNFSRAGEYGKNKKRQQHAEEGKDQGSLEISRSVSKGHLSGTGRRAEDAYFYARSFGHGANLYKEGLTGYTIVRKEDMTGKASSLLLCSPLVPSRSRRNGGSRS